MSALLKNMNVLITGSARGIGRRTAEEMAKAGANIIVSDIDIDECKETINYLKQFGTICKAYKLDVSNLEGLKDFVEIIEQEMGAIDVLVNNAGVTSTSQILDLTPDEWDEVMNVNIKGAFFLSQALYARMKVRKKGRIINIGSISGERGAKYAGAHYSISKAAVIMMTKVFAKHAADSGVTVNTVSPGMIATEMSKRLGTQIDPNDVPMNRFGTTDEVAQTIVFLASNNASYITGQNISVNGGQSMR